MDIEQFRTKFNPRYSQHLRKNLDQTSSFFDDDVLPDALMAVNELFGMKGKRMRPYMIYLMYISADGVKFDDPIICGLAMEMLHSFALIHDDIIDRGGIRHGVKTIHEQIKRSLTNQTISYDIEHMANSQAMLIGDLMLTWSYDALNQLRNRYNDKVAYYFQDMANKVVVGEMMDVSFPSRQSVSEQELNKRDLYKTATYTFINPMIMGAVLAGREKEYLVFCQRFGSLMGEVYQIHDDILDIIGEDGTPGLSDIREHQHTFLTQYVARSGNSRDRKTLTEYFSGVRADKANENKVMDILSKPEVIGYAKAEADRRIEEAKKVLIAQKFRSQKEELWLKLIDYFESRFV